jgi:hypothetical protein
VFGFGPGNQNVASDAEVAAIKLLHAGDLLRGLPLKPLMKVTAIVDPPDFAQFFVGMGMQPRAVMTYGVRQQDLGGEAGNCDSSLFKKLPALQQRRVNGQAASLCSLSFSVW